MRQSPPREICFLFVERSGLRLHFGRCKPPTRRDAALFAATEAIQLNDETPIASNAQHCASRRRDADDGAVYRDQGGEPGFAAVLPHGRFLRAVLRRCGGGEPRARHRAHQARQASGPGHPDVRRAGACRRRLSAEADRAGLPRRGLRADRGPGRGEEARRQVGGAARRGPAGDARHHHRGEAARAVGIELPDGAGGQAGARGSGSATNRPTRWPGSRCRPASSASPRPTPTGCCPTSSASTRAS